MKEKNKRVDLYENEEKEKGEREEGERKKGRRRKGKENGTGKEKGRGEKWKKEDYGRVKMREKRKGIGRRERKTTVRNKRAINE